MASDVSAHDDPEPVFNEATGKWEWPNLSPLPITVENVRRVIDDFPPDYPVGPGGGTSVYAMRGRPHESDSTWNPASGGLPSLGKGYS